MGGGREPAQVMVMEAGEPAAEKQVKSCRAEWGADALFPFLCYDVLDVLC